MLQSSVSICAQVELFLVTTNMICSHFLILSTSSIDVNEQSWEYIYKDRGHYYTVSTLIRQTSLGVISHTMISIKWNGLFSYHLLLGEQANPPLEVFVVFSSLTGQVF